MGITYKKRPDQDIWEADIGSWRVEISQNENGDWLWVVYDREWVGPMLEMKGVQPTQSKAEWWAHCWVKKLSIKAI